MKKKEYKAPELELLRVQFNQCIAQSGGGSGGNFGDGGDDAPGLFDFDELEIDISDVL